MKRLLTFALVLSAAPVWALTPAQIVQETSRVVNISTGAARLRAVLDREVTKLIAAGPLMPFRMQYGEGVSSLGGVARHDYAFQEPWMMMHTLARAYPYVSPSLQGQIVAYVQSENQRAAPWGTSALGATGSPRQGDPSGALALGLPASYKRRGALFYALWLYGSTTGDWSFIEPQWAAIKTVYDQVKAGPRTYELLSGAIGMARLATQFNDAAGRTQFEADAATFMNEGLSFAAYRANAHTDYTGQGDWYRGTDGIAYPLFHLTPEAARYVSDNAALKAAVINYVEAQPTRVTDVGEGGVDVPSPGYVWPLWWMAQAPNGDGGYFSEGAASGAEQRMMLFNYFAWIKNASPAQMALWVDVPDALVGDCFFLQNLVTAIEQFGTRGWGTVAADPTPPSPPRNLRRR